MAPSDGSTAAEIVHAVVLRLLYRDARTRSALSVPEPPSAASPVPASSPVSHASAVGSHAEEGPAAAGRVSTHLDETQLIDVTFTALCDMFIGDSGGGDDGHGDEDGAVGVRDDVVLPVAAPGNILRNWYAAYMAEVHDANEDAPPVIVVMDDVASFPPALFNDVLSMLTMACIGSPQAPAVPLLLVCGCSTTKNAVQALHGNVLRHLLLRELYLPAVMSVRRAVIDDLLLNGHFPLLLPGSTHDLLDAHLSAYQEGLLRTADMLKGAMALHCNRTPVGYLRPGHDVVAMEKAGCKAGAGGSEETAPARSPGRPRKETNREPPRLDPRDVPYAPSLWLAPVSASSASSSAVSASTTQAPTPMLTPRIAMHCVPLADWAAGFAKMGLSSKQLQDRASLSSVLSASLCSSNGLPWPSVSMALPWTTPLYNLSMRVAAWIPEAEVQHLAGQLPSVAGKHESILQWADTHWVPVPSETGHMPATLPQAKDDAALFAALDVEQPIGTGSATTPKRGKAARSTSAVKPGTGREAGRGDAQLTTPTPDKKLSKLLRDHEVWFISKRGTVRGGVSDDDPAVTGIPACDAPIARDPGSQAWAPLTPYPWAALVENVGEEYALVQPRALLAVCHYRWACWRLGFRAVAACITSVACRDACSLAPVHSSPAGTAASTSTAGSGAPTGRLLLITNKSLRVLHAECMGDSAADELAQSTRRSELHRVIHTLSLTELRQAVANVVHTLCYGGGPTAALGAGTVPGIPIDSVEADPLSSVGLPVWSRAIHPAALFLPHVVAGRDILHRLVHNVLSFDKTQEATAGAVKPVMVKGVAKSPEKRRQEALSAAITPDRSSDGSTDSRCLQGAREAVSLWLTELAQAYLCSPTALPMHEVFLFRHGKDWEEVHCPDHRQSLFKALTCPWALPYSGVPTPTDTEAITPDMPDLTVAFRTLSIQRGRVVHLGVWYQEWRDVFLPHLSSTSGQGGSGMGAGGRVAGKKGKAAVATDTDRSMMTTSAVEDVMGEEAMDAPGAAYDLGSSLLEGPGSIAYTGSAALLTSPGRAKARKSETREAASAAGTAENEEELEALLEDGSSSAAFVSPTAAQEALYSQAENGEGGGVEGASPGVKRKRGRPKGSGKASRPSTGGTGTGQAVVTKEEQGIADRFWAAALQLDKQGVIRLFRRGGSDFAEKKLFDVVSW